MYTVIFGQLSPEKPNAGKPVQQMRVLLIFQQMISLQQNIRQINSKPPETESLAYSDKFLTPITAPASPCVSLRDSPRSPRAGLHESMWRLRGFSALQPQAASNDPLLPSDPNLDHHWPPPSASATSRPATLPLRSNSTSEWISFGYRVYALLVFQVTFKPSFITSYWRTNDPA